MTTKPDITYCSWDGNPALLARYKDGRILGFEHVDGTWKDVHGADVATKGVVMEKSEFEEAYPDLELPTFPE